MRSKPPTDSQSNRRRARGNKYHAMSALHDTDGGEGDERLRILFFHGLNGHYQNTWKSSGSSEFWPSWLLIDAPGTRVTSVEYDAAASRWLSDPMTISDRAMNIASQLAAVEAYATTPIALIGHSLGGNVIKALIRHLHDHQSNNPRYKDILSNIRLVAFLGTPNTGSHVPKLLPRILRKILRTTPVVEELNADSPVLRDLALWYRSNMPKMANHVVLVETKPTVGSLAIVSPSSSDPGLPDVLPIPIDADHIGIAKPSDRDSEIYKIILDRVKSVLAESLPPILRGPGDTATDPLERTARRRRGLSSRVDSHRKSLIESAGQRPFTVLLCGPASPDPQSHAVILCTKIGDLLTANGFDVVYGQSSGLTNERLGNESNTLGRELDFIGSQCNAVIIIASGASGWVELGLFGWHLACDRATREKGVDMVVIADETQIDFPDFLRGGPISYSEGVGRADIVSLETYDPVALLSRMQARRTMYVMDRRGRPRKPAR